MTPVRASSRAFTLLELVIVLATLGLIVGVTAPRLVRSGARAQAERAVRGLNDALVTQRAEAIRSMTGARLFIAGRTGPEELAVRLVRSNEPDAVADALQTALIERGESIEPFETLGVWEGVTLRSSPDRPPALWDVRTLIFEPGGGARLEGEDGSIALVASGGDGTIWRIGFDPISGSPRITAD